MISAAKLVLLLVLWPVVSELFIGVSVEEDPLVVSSSILSFFIVTIGRVSGTFLVL
jgi:hypothetical protein